MGRTVLAAAPETDFVMLARTPSGTLFRKEILKVGDSFVHPNNPKRRINIDSAFAKKIVANFKAGYCDVVQFPEVDDSNHHSEAPSRNRGEVIDLTYDEAGIYATIDVRKNPADVGVTLLGASAMMNLDYLDTRSGNRVGPTLLHVAGTNRPYLTNLKPYEPVIALSAVDTDGEVVMLTHSEETMDLDEMLEVLLSEHGIDVVALQERADAGGDSAGLVAALSAVISAADPDNVSLSAADGDISVQDVAEAVVELSRGKAAADDEVLELSARLGALESMSAEADVDQRVRDGYILPTSRDAMLEIKLSDPEMYDRLLPASPLVSLSEDGVTVHDRPGNAGYDHLEDEVDRLSGVVQGLNGHKG